MMSGPFAASPPVKRDRPRPCGAAIGILIALLVTIALCVPDSPATAQEDWMPIVATSPGVTVGAYASPAPGRVSPMIDPRFFPAPNTPATAHKTAPQGAWSPIVTGALPAEARALEDDDVAAAGRTSPSGAIVAPLPVPPLAGAPSRKTRSEKVLAATEGEAGAPAAKAAGGEAAPASPPDAAPASGPFKPVPLEALPPDATAAQQYCFNTADAAADARFAWQAKKIKDMEAELEQRSKQLEAKTEEYKTWLARRDDFSRKAQEKLVGFYTKMRPDAAALQLAAMDEETAAALLTKLEPKVASAVMGEMDPVRAAKLASIVSGAARVQSDKRAPAQSAAKPPQSANGAPPQPANGAPPQPAGGAAPPAQPRS
jgi:flagellar motility protein MotE (MotC chaperone)